MKTATSAAEVPLQPASWDIWDQKYRLKTKEGAALDETIDATLQRVAHALAEVEATPELRHFWHEKFLWALRHGAVPAGRIISNAGAWQHKPATSTINCTVSDTILDSMDDILRKVHQAGLTLKAGCGIGYEFSTLRPRGAYVSGAGAYTSGPLSFMDIYDKMCFTVSSAGGRRGAQMGTFDIGHPDVMEFIRAKREAGRLRQFNLSLLITSEFIEAVQQDAEWQLAFPLLAKEAEQDRVDLDDASQILWREWPTQQGLISDASNRVACKIYRSIRARRLWDLIMASTYDYAEPGFILIDEVNAMNNNWFCEKVRASNPCVTADTWIQTALGPRQVRDLVGHRFIAQVDGHPYPSGPQGFFYTAEKPVVLLETTEGYRLKLTADHRVRRVQSYGAHSVETEWAEAGTLRVGDRVVLNDHRASPQWSGDYGHSEGYLIGLLIGDGTLKADAAVLSVWQVPKVAQGLGATQRGSTQVMAEALEAAHHLPHRANFAGWFHLPDRHESRLCTAALRDLALALGLHPTAKTVTPALEKTSSAFYQGFLRGLFDADGSVQGDQRKGGSIRLAQSNLGLLQGVQRMLLRLGIASRLYGERRAAGKSLLPDGHGGKAYYPTQAQHELVISGENLQRFRDCIGFADSDKAARLNDLLAGYRRALNQERFTARVAAITPVGVEAVYDTQIAEVHSFDANGFHAHNCGEQMLPPFGSCLLGSVNLTPFVQNPFTPEARFDWDCYRQVVAVFTRMLDNVVEINGLPLEQQRQEILSKRRHGMGYLGLGSTLTMLRMPYGSPESLAFTEEVTREMALTGWRVALELAQEKGPAPILEQDFTVTEALLRQRPELVRDGYAAGDTVKGRVLHARYSRYMQRLAALDPQLIEDLAQTGARFTHHTSIAPTGTIALSLANNASNGIEPSFAHHYSRNVIRPGKKSKEKVDVFSFELLAYRHLINPQALPDTATDEQRLPDYFITADDITPQQHIDIQAAAQKWVDSSISKTINIPTDYPYEQFKDVYLYAYKQGLKGCTTFRFNPAAFQGVLVKDHDLANTRYCFVLEDGSEVEVKGNEEIEYDGELHTAANLFDALKEGYYGKW